MCTNKTTYILYVSCRSLNPYYYWATALKYIVFLLQIKILMLFL